MNELVESFKKRKYDYCDIYKHKKTIKLLSKGYRDINFFIAVKGKTDYFRATLNNVLISLKNSDLKIKVIVVEQDETPINYEFCKELNIDYIFIPQEISHSENLHSTALMYNVGYLFCYKSIYNMFHCCDILLPHNFFSVLGENYLKKNNFTWLQPFHGKRVISVDEDTTKRFLSGELISEDPSNELISKKYIPEQTGAPGGCICVYSKTMDEIGGYDPELFYGYSPEDAFFWAKLEVVTNKCKISNLHTGIALYADDPIIDVYHLNHERQIDKNQNYKDMLKIYLKFIEDFSFENQLEYIDIKAKKFKKDRKKLIKLKESL